MSARSGAHYLRWWSLFALCASPLAWEVWRIAANRLGTEPGKELTTALGEWSIMALLLTLAVSPFRAMTGQAFWLRYRRMIGLWCLFYVVLHVVAYALFLADWSDIVSDLIDRAYISVGAIALLGLLVLGATSPKVMVRRLGRRWRTLHRSIYFITPMALLHIWWQVRSDYGEALLYTVIALVLFGFRYSWLKGVMSAWRQ